MISNREAVSIAELAAYSPLFVAAVIVNFRQGFSRHFGWFYLVLFCVLRIAGSALEVVSSKHPTNIDDAAWATILSSVGLSPLLLANLGLLRRVNDAIEPRSWRVLGLRVMHVPCIVGLVLAIVGGTDIESYKNASKVKDGSNLLKASAILFLVAFLGLVALAAATAIYLRNLRSPEIRIMMAVLAAIPFLLVRMIYVILVDYANSKTFSVLNGNVFAQLGMAIIEEFIIVLIFIAVGLTTPPMTDPAVGDHIPLSSGGKFSNNGRHLHQQQA